MFPEYWLLSRELSNIAAKCLTGLLIACYLIFYVDPVFSSRAEAFISTGKIEQLEKKHTGNIKKRFKAWKNIINSAKNLTTEQKLTKTNDFFNQFLFQSDLAYQSEGDYWKSPDEFVVDAGGDCEDFSIAKYFTLLAMGVPMKQLRITYVKSLQLNQAHMVLAFYKTPDAEPLVLDNLNGRILPASKRPDLVPVYSFNGGGLWLAKERSQDKYLGQSDRLSKWRRVLERIKDMGK